MTRRYFARLSYRGVPFHGWQTQPGEVTVQSTLEGALSRVMRREVKVTGAGRTDTGVNARVMIAHFDLDEPCQEFDLRTLGAINALCGRDIAVERVWEVPADAHARFDATRRTYRYFTHMGKSPFLYPLSWQEPRKFDFVAMEECCRLLEATSDFTSFAKLHSDARTNICRVDTARWLDLGDGRHAFEISADRFLRNMVRAVVGTLVEVGRGKLTPEGFRRVVDARDRCAAGTSMPPHPLFLWDVEYPAHLLPQE